MIVVPHSWQEGQPKCSTILLADICFLLFSHVEWEAPGINLAPRNELVTGKLIG
jgi:hypothetical protein